MACSDQISTEDLLNAKLDATTLGEVATSRAGAESGGAPITKSTNRFNETTDTIQGRLNKLGVIVDDPIKNWSASLLVSDLRAHRYPATTGDVYVPVKPLPFTTGLTFNSADWVLWNGYADTQIENVLINDTSQAYEFELVIDMTGVFPLKKKLSVKSGYYAINDGGGGGDYVVDNTTIADGYCDIDLGGGLTAVLQGNIIDIRQAGCKPGDYSFDNVDRIKSAVKRGVGVIPSGVGKFYSTPIRFNSDYDYKSLIGLNEGSNLSLISSGAAAVGVPLLHIPQVGGSYGGTEVGAVGFYMDLFTVDGEDATNTFATTGLVVEKSTNFTFGTLWTHGFYKSGALLTGDTVNFIGGTLISFNNGNQVGAATGGQGIAIAVTNTDEPSVVINTLIGYGNGTQNFGQALDANSGNFTIDRVIAHDNGASAMKVVSCNKGTIGKLIANNNNKHVGQSFSTIYSNGSFGELYIDRFESSDSAGSCVSHSNNGHIHIGSLKDIGPSTNFIVLTPGGGIKSKLTIDNVEAGPVGLSFINQTGDSVLKIGTMELESCPNQGMILNGTKTTIGDLEIIDSLGTPLWLRSGDVTITSVRISRTDLAGGTATLIDVGVSNAAILTIKTKGYTTPLNDNSLTTYAPNVVTL